MQKYESVGWKPTPIEGDFTISPLKKKALVAINILVGTYVAAFILGTAYVVQLSTNRPLAERDAPIIDLSGFQNALAGNLYVMAGAIAFVTVLLPLGFVWTALKMSSTSGSSPLYTFPGIGLGLKLVAPAVLLLFAPHLGGWAFLLAIFCAFATVGLVSTALSVWTHSSGPDSPVVSTSITAPPVNPHRPTPRRLRHIKMQA